jgi:hypothetical protein
MKHLFTHEKLCQQVSCNWYDVRLCGIWNCAVLISNCPRLQKMFSEVIKSSLPSKSKFTIHSENTRKFDFCKSVHHHTIQINQPTRCNNFTSLLLDVYVWLNMFRPPLHPSGAYNCTRSLSGSTVGALLVVVWQVMRKQSLCMTCHTTTNNAPTVEPEAPSAVMVMRRQSLRITCHTTTNNAAITTLQL